MLFIDNLDILPLNSPSDTVSINKLTDTFVLKIRSQCDVKRVIQNLIFLSNRRVLED
jgi:hypothetical protein